jgi:hypothetical protein
MEKKARRSVMRGHTAHNENPIFLQSLLKNILSVEYVERKTDSGPDVPATGWYAKYVVTIIRKRTYAGLAEVERNARWWLEQHGAKAKTAVAVRKHAIDAERGVRQMLQLA